MNAYNTQIVLVLTDTTFKGVIVICIVITTNLYSNLILYLTVMRLFCFIKDSAQLNQASLFVGGGES